MSIFINKNLFSNGVISTLNSHYSSMGESIKRLSTGLRINSAKDDPSGKATREIMRAEIGVMNRGIKNTLNAVSLVQTAESSLQIIDERLIKMKELAEQASTGTYTKEQRLIIHSHFASIAAEIDRIASSTTFSDIKLLDGSVSSSTKLVESSGWYQVDGEDHSDKANYHFTKNGKLKIHFGTGNDRVEDYYYITLNDMRAPGLFNEIMPENSNGIVTDFVSLSTQHGAQLALRQIDSAMKYKEFNRAQLGIVQNRLENTLNQYQIQVENYQDAESKLSDIDVADEMGNFVKTQVLTQTAIAMLAQANTIPRMAMKLLA